MAKKSEITSERVRVEKTLKMPKLVQTLRVNGYKLLLTSKEEQNIYNIEQPKHRVYEVVDECNNKLLGEIVIRTECVRAETESEISYVPYDLSINTSRIKSEFEKDIPIELFKKVILATITLS